MNFGIDQKNVFEHTANQDDKDKSQKEDDKAVFKQKAPDMPSLFESPINNR